MSLLLINLPYSYSFSPRGVNVAAGKRPGHQVVEPLLTKALLSYPKLYSKVDDSDAVEKSIEPVIIRGFEESEISDETLEAIEDSEPSEWVIMKEVSL